MFILPEEYVEKFKSGIITIAKIATELNKSKSTVYDNMKKQGIDTSVHRNKLLKKDRNNEIIERFLAGERIIDIAKTSGISRQRIHQIVERYTPPNSIRTIVPPIPFEIPSHLIEQFKRGEISSAKIAVKLGTYYEKVRKYFQIRGIYSPNNRFWTEEKVIAAIKALGYMPKALELKRSKRHSLYYGIQVCGGFQYFRKLFEEK